MKPKNFKNPSHDEENSQSELENLKRIDIIYEFPEEDAESSAIFSVSDEEIALITKDSSSESKSDDISPMIQDDVDNYSQQKAKLSKISSDGMSICTPLSRRYKDCVIEIEDVTAPSKSKSPEESIPADNSSKSKIADGARKRNLSHVESNVKSEDSGKRPKGSFLLQTLHNQQKNTIEIASNDDDGFADVEDNTDVSSPKTLQSKQSYNSKPKHPIKNSNTTNSAHLIKNHSLRACDQDRDYISNNNSGENFDSKKKSGNSVDSSPSCSTANNGSVNDGHSSKSRQLKAKSKSITRKGRRCGVCNKKLDLTAITCRCGGTYCAKHRYDKEHGCTFDYKAMGAKQIRKDNPQVVAEKIKKI